MEQHRDVSLDLFPAFVASDRGTPVTLRAFQVVPISIELSHEQSPAVSARMITFHIFVRFTQPSMPVLYNPGSPCLPLVIGHFPVAASDWFV